MLLKAGGLFLLNTILMLIIHLPGASLGLATGPGSLAADGGSLKLPDLIIILTPVFCLALVHPRRVNWTGLGWAGLGPEAWLDRSDGSLSK